MNCKVVFAFVGCAVAASMAMPQLGDLPKPHAEGGYDKHGEFQYINVPAHKVFEWGYKRGNPHHFREEYLSQKDHAFKAKVKWADTHDGYGEHFYDYNHFPKHDDKHHGGYHEPIHKPAPIPHYKPNH